MVRAYSLYEGSYSVDKSKKFIPFDPKKDDPKDRPGSLFIHVHPFLVETEAGLVLLDTGLGQRTADDELLIHANIKKLGFDIDDVRFVLMSHLHKDHANGMVDFKDGVKRIAFPNAEYYVQEKEWEAAFSTESPSYRTDVFDVVQRSGNLNFVNGDGYINDEIRYNLSGGHSEFHQVFHIETGGEHFFFGGDELPEPEEIFRNFIAKYDFDGRKAKALREEYWAAGAPEGWVFMFYHSKSIAIGRPEKREDGSYKIIDATK
ncbi:MBL fold metallo-hydrolase [Sphingobacterium humi]|uniref:MBL fold metallo-hydrolase n=1 Tax=Sphingobacterium humi TaxID=1796905 RepID=A0A6N8KWY1_9SPHI|nr:MBL fold metallo-hydrolase [Sphingobacterium humi]MVZ61586.1 MBL fold metallo-hydrolase [Sphingobacterium humi]